MAVPLRGHVGGGGGALPVLAWHTLEEALDGEGKTDKVTTEEQE